MAKKKEMNRTSGTAKRKVDTAGKLLTSKEVGTAIKKGGPLTGSASGVKSISLKQAGEVLTQGIVTLGKKGLQMDPASLAMALPIGKVAKAAKALRAAGNAGDAAQFTKAIALEQRVGAKAAGKAFGQSLAERKAAKGGPIFETIMNVGRTRRAASEKVFKRGGNKGVGTSVNEYVARSARKSDLPMTEKRLASEAVKQTSTGFTKFSKGAAKKGETVSRGRGTVNPEGYAKLQKMQDPIVRFYTAAERGIKRKGK